jgi:hypothetical protein
LDSSVAKLKAWFQTLDNEMKEVVSALSDEDLSKEVHRGQGGFPVETQLDVYVQACLIFFGKAVIYLKAMNKPLLKTLQDYIG